MNADYSVILDACVLLLTLFSIDPGVVVFKLNAVAQARNKTMQAVLADLQKSVPAFSDYVAEAIGLDLD